MCLRLRLFETAIGYKLSYVMPRQRKRKLGLSKQTSRQRNLCRSAKRVKNEVDLASDMKLDKYSLLACGSFNPITNMHLRMFEIARNYLTKLFGQCLIRGVISPVSDGYGKQGLESSKHRLDMCCIGCQNSDWIDVSSWECKKKQWTPTVEVLQRTRAQLESEGHISKLFLLCGSDLLESFCKPGLWKMKDIEAIVKDFGIIVVTRPGYDSNKAIESNEVLCQYKKDIHVITDIISNDTSSTLVRQAIQAEQSIKYLTPDNVIKYIQEHKLYSTRESELKNSGETLAPYHVNSRTG